MFVCLKYGKSLHIFYTEFRIFDNNDAGIQISKLRQAFFEFWGEGDYIGGVDSVGEGCGANCNLINGGELTELNIWQNWTTPTLTIFLAPSLNTILGDRMDLV